MTFGPCAPQPAAPPVYMTPCQQLSVMQSALYSLLAGKTRAQVRFGDQWVSYHNGNVKELRAEVRRLEAICTDMQTGGAGRAVQAGPRRVSDGFYNGRYR